MNYIRMKAYAKINLGLDVLGTLDNGYHEVKMIMQSIDLYDKVNLQKNNSGRITIRTNLSYLPVGPDNLVYKAAKLLFDEFNITDGLDIDLYKFIPVSAGMAGGSTDAAAVLKGVNILFNLGLRNNELMERGAKLGADIPYCILGNTALAEGIGDRLTSLKNCPDCHLVIGKPSVSVSTKFVYDRLVLDENTVHPDIDGIINAIEAGDIYGVASRLGNVLEDVTRKEYPVIGKIEEFMRENGAIGALMSGSGPTVFGIFDDEEKAVKCNSLLRESRLVRSCYRTGLVNGGRKWMSGSQK